MKTFRGFIKEGATKKIKWVKEISHYNRRAGKDTPEYKFKSSDGRFEVAKSTHPMGRRGRNNKVLIVWVTYDYLALSNGKSDSPSSTSAADAKKKAELMLQNNSAEEFKQPISSMYK